MHQTGPKSNSFQNPFRLFVITDDHCRILFIPSQTQILFQYYKDTCVSIPKFIALNSRYTTVIDGGKRTKRKQEGQSFVCEKTREREGIAFFALWDLRPIKRLLIIYERRWWFSLILSPISIRGRFWVFFWFDLGSVLVFFSRFFRFVCLWVV